MKDEKRSSSKLITCELCSRQMTPELFYTHLSEHTIEEVELLKKLGKKTMKMTSEELRAFVSALDLESYRLVQQVEETSN